MILIARNKKEQETYNVIKSLIFKCVKERYLNLKNPSYIMRKNICDCLSILILSGINYSWPSCITDLIKEAINGCPELSFIVLRSLADIDLIINFQENNDDTWDDYLNFEQKEKSMIKNKLISHNETILEFIGLIYQNLNKFEQNLKNRIICSIIDLLKLWTQFRINILTTPDISKLIFNLIEKTEENNKETNIK